MKRDAKFNSILSQVMCQLQQPVTAPLTFFFLLNLHGDNAAFTNSAEDEVRANTTAAVHCLDTAIIVLFPQIGFSLILLKAYLSPL